MDEKFVYVVLEQWVTEDGDDGTSTDLFAYEMDAMEYFNTRKTQLQDEDYYDTYEDDDEDFWCGYTDGYYMSNHTVLKVYKQSVKTN